MGVGEWMLKSGRNHSHIFRRFAHTNFLSSSITHFPSLLLPDTDHHTRFTGFSFFDEAIQLMAVPKKKTSPHKRGIRNGPKALKPQPVIVLCKACGRVKLQHFFCCSGKKEHSEHNQ